MKMKTPRPIISSSKFENSASRSNLISCHHSKFLTSSSFNIDLSKQFANIRTIDSKYKV